MRSPKQKKLTYKVIEPKSDDGKRAYRMLRELVGTYHGELEENKARIALAWALSWKPDGDDRTVIGKCKLVGALERELMPYDFVIVLNESFWHDEAVTDKQRLALLDHELSHAAVKLDAAGDPVEDERGRVVFRIRKHDIEEFSAVVGRHGLYKSDLVAFFDEVREKQGNLDLGLVGDDAGEESDDAGDELGESPVM